MKKPFLGQKITLSSSTTITMMLPTIMARRTASSFVTEITQPSSSSRSFFFFRQRRQSQVQWQRKSSSTQQNALIFLRHHHVTTKLYQQQQLRLYQSTTVQTKRGGSGCYGKRNIQARKKKQTKKQIEEAVAIEPCHYGPLGRTALTETRLQGLLLVTSPNTIAIAMNNYGGGLAGVRELLNSANRVKTPKMALLEGKDKLQFETPQFRFEQLVEEASTKNGNYMHKVTAVTIVPKYDVLPTDIYEQMKNHNHVASHPEFDWLELISVGIATTKKRGVQLAALDQIALINEAIGIDLTAPSTIPDFASQNQLLEEKSFRLQYAQSEALLELLRCSRIMYDYVKVVATTPSQKTSSKGRKRRKKATVNNKQQQWVADAETIYQGKKFFSTGEKSSNKKDAERSALIALLEQNDILTKEASIYRKLIEASPSRKHVSSLRVPRLSDAAYENLHESLGYSNSNNNSRKIVHNNLNVDDDTIEKEHAERKEQHRLLKEKYEQQWIQRREEKQKRSSLQNEQQQQLYAESGGRESVSQYLLQQEQQKLERIKDSTEFMQMQTIRNALPISEIRGEFLQGLKTNQVVVVSGGTGSGKSTQCPQYVLEDAIKSMKGANTRIVVTQPRRIAAVSVSDRVSAERFDSNKASRCDNSNSSNLSVGYSVRFRSKKPRREGGSIEFLTTGILLRRLIHDPTLEGISHVMIDEVHERDINTDFLLILLRDLLKIRPDLKCILMSATLDANSFGEYFATTNAVCIEDNDNSSSFSQKQVPVFSVPAKPRHPVEVFYLEDIAVGKDDTARNIFSNRATELASSLLQYNDEKLWQELKEARAAFKEEKEFSGFHSSNSSDINSDRIAILERAVSLRGENALSLSDSPMRSKKFDFRHTMTELISEIALHLSQEEINANRAGSILCFLPGMDEIKQCKKEIEKRCPSQELRNKIKILPLHSTIPQDDQQKVFEPANPGTIKLILSTNIAESSVTIDDVLAVVDSGLVREMNFDAQSAMSTMETSKASKTSATQRLGRTGRVAPGKCYRIFSRGDLETREERPSPEIQRTALEATCLQTCSMMVTNNINGNDGNKMGVEEFLSRAMDPPVEGAVAFAMDRLIKLGAITTTEDTADDGGKVRRQEYLTPLGRCLAQLPLDPAIGKMLVMGVVMKCVGPLLTAASCFSSKNAFHEPPDLREETKNIRKSFSSKSDVTAMVRAYDEFWDIVNIYGWKTAKDWAFDNAVSILAMNSIKAVRLQLLNELCKARLIPKGDVCRSKSRSNQWHSNVGGRDLRQGAAVNQNADCEMLASAIWCTAFPENLASRRGSIGHFGVLRTSRDENAGLHPSSVLFYRKPSDIEGSVKDLPTWYLFREKVLTSQLFLRSCSAMSPEQILLFGGYGLDTSLARDNANAMNLDSTAMSTSSTNSNNRIKGVIDGWIAVERKNDSSDKTVDLLIRARENIEMIFERKIMFPNNKKNRVHYLLPDPFPGDDRIIDGVRATFDSLDENVIYYENDEMSEISPSDDFYDYFLEEEDKSSVLE